MKQKYILLFKRAHTYNENVEMLSRLRTVSFIMVRGLAKNYRSNNGCRYPFSLQQCSYCQDSTQWLKTWKTIT